MADQPNSPTDSSAREVRHKLLPDALRARYCLDLLLLIHKACFFWLPTCSARRSGLDARRRSIRHLRHNATATRHRRPRQSAAHGRSGGPAVTVTSDCVHTTVLSDLVSRRGTSLTYFIKNPAQIGAVTLGMSFLYRTAIRIGVYSAENTVMLQTQVPPKQLLVLPVRLLSKIPYRSDTLTIYRTSTVPRCDDADVRPAHIPCRSPNESSGSGSTSGSVVASELG